MAWLGLLTELVVLKKRILLVNQHTVPVFTDVINAIAATNHEVVLFTGHLEPGSQPLFPGVAVVRSIRYNRANSITRLLTWILFAFHYFFYLSFARKKPTVVLCVTNPPFAPLITGIVCRWRRIVFHLLLYDLYPEALAQVGFVRTSNPIYKAWQKVNHIILNKAEKLYTLSDSMKEASLVYVRDPAKVKVIHNWTDTSYIRPMAREENPFARKHNFIGKKVILYAGNMGLTHDLESLLLAAEILKHNDQIVFLFIGEGGKKRKLISMTEERQLTNVVFLPYQDSQTFPFAMASADIGVITLGPGAEGVSVPSKTYVNLAAGLCLLVIAPKNSEISRLVEFYKAGVVAEPGNHAEVASLIEQLIADDQKLWLYQKNARTASADFTPANARLYVHELGLDN